MAGEERSAAVGTAEASKTMCSLWLLGAPPALCVSVSHNASNYRDFNYSWVTNFFD